MSNSITLENMGALTSYFLNFVREDKVVRGFEKARLDISSCLNESIEYVSSNIIYIIKNNIFYFLRRIILSYSMLEDRVYW